MATRSRPLPNIQLLHIAFPLLNEAKREGTLGRKLAMGGVGWRGRKEEKGQGRTKKREWITLFCVQLEASCLQLSFAYKQFWECLLALAIEAFIVVKKLLAYCGKRRLNTSTAKQALNCKQKAAPIVSKEFFLLCRQKPLKSRGECSPPD